MRRTVYGALLLFFGFVALASAGTSRLPPHPTDCNRNACDVDRAMCEIASRTKCTGCMTSCIEAAGDDNASGACAIACRDLCDKGVVTARCKISGSSCSFSPRNAFCTDGLDVKCVPEPWTAVKAPIPSIKRRPNACSDSEIDGLVDACWSPASTKTTCDAFSEKNPVCVKCAAGETGAELDVASPWAAQGLCVAMRGHAACGETIHELEACTHTACHRCSRGSDQCIEAAGKISCQHEKANMDECVAKLPSNVRADCITVDSNFRNPAKLVIRQACGN